MLSIRQCSACVFVVVLAGSPQGRWRIILSFVVRIGIVFGLASFKLRHGLGQIARKLEFDTRSTLVDVARRGGDGRDGSGRRGHQVATLRQSGTRWLRKCRHGIVVVTIGKQVILL